MKFTPRDLFQFATFAVFALWTFGLSVAVGYTAAMFNISYRLATGEQVVGQQVIVNAATWASVAFVAFYLFGMYWLFKLAFYTEQTPEPEPTVKEIIRSADGHQLLLREIPATERQIREVSNRIMWGGHSFTHDEMAGLFATRADFVAFRRYLLKEGALEWVNPQSHQQGIIVTEAGAIWFADRADRARSIPSPSADGER